MAEAARFVVNRTEPLLRELFLPQGYQVHLVGHSLAGGTATLAAALLRFEMGINATCTVFAPPPTLDGRAARKSLRFEDFVHVVVLGDDVVPRFNFPVLAASAAVLHEFVQQSEQLGMTPDEFYRTHSFEDKLAAIKDQVDKVSRRNGLHRDMHLAGRIFFFLKTEDDGYVWREVLSDFPALRRFDGLSLDLVRDHLMDNYESMLQAIVDKQDGKRRQRTLAVLRYERSVFAPGASRLSAHGPLCANSLARDGPQGVVDELSIFSSIF
jgi:pimeloyl-ACP methyl ester carboxylesterase